MVGVIKHSDVKGTFANTIDPERISDLDHKNIGFLSNTGPYPLKNHKATKPAFKVWPSSACQRNAI